MIKPSEILKPKLPRSLEEKIDNLIRQNFEDGTADFALELSDEEFDYFRLLSSNSAWQIAARVIESTYSKFWKVEIEIQKNFRYNEWSHRLLCCFRSK